MQLLNHRKKGEKQYKALKASTLIFLCVFIKKSFQTWSLSPTSTISISPPMLIQPEPQGLWEFTPRLNHT